MASRKRFIDLLESRGWLGLSNLRKQRRNSRGRRWDISRRIHHQLQVEGFFPNAQVVVKDRCRYQQKGTNDNSNQKSSYLYYPGQNSHHVWILRGETQRETQGK